MTSRTLHTTLYAGHQYKSMDNSYITENNRTETINKYPNIHLDNLKKTTTDSCRDCRFTMDIRTKYFFQH